MRRLVFAALVLSPAFALALTPIELNQDEFKMFRQYQKAMGDPQVEKIKPAKRMEAIAKDAHFKVKDLEAAVKKGEAAGDLKATCEANLKESIGGALPGQLGTVEVDTSEPHAVTYVQWLNDNPSQLEEEASQIAALSARDCPIAATIQVWAQDKQNPKARVFQALIAADAARKINLARAKDFADTRYIKLFEQVKSVAHGDDLSGQTAGQKPEPAPQPSKGGK